MHLNLKVCKTLWWITLYFYYIALAMIWAPHLLGQVMMIGEVLIRIDTEIFFYSDWLLSLHYCCCSNIEWNRFDLMLLLSDLLWFHRCGSTTVISYYSYLNDGVLRTWYSTVHFLVKINKRSNRHNFLNCLSVILSKNTSKQKDQQKHSQMHSTPYS